MNNKYLASLLCITILAVAPSCKRQEKASTKEDINTMIELNDSVVEFEDTLEIEQSVTKF